jgi:hypothetical protein
MVSKSACLASGSVFERFLAFEPAARRRPPPAPIIFVLEEEDPVFGMKNE